MTAETRLIGNDGRPRKIPKNLFLLRPENLEYLNNDISSLVPTASEINNRRDSLITLAFLSPFICGICSIITLIGNGGTVPFLENDRSKLEFIGFSIVILILPVITLIPWLNAWLRRSTLSESGVVLIGQIESIKGQWKVRKRVNSYYVTVIYQVRLPDDTVLNGVETSIYMDMVGKRLPPRGTPVAILYISHREKMLL